MTKAIPNRQIAEEAADWAIRMDAGPLDPAQRQALARWLKASPAHVDELLYCAAILGSLEGVDRERKLATEDDALPPEPEVIPLFAAAPAAMGGGPYRPGQRALPKRWAIAASVALLAAAALALAGLGTSPAEEPAQTLATRLYTTDLGEQRSVTLADGSVVFLNTDSRVRVRLTDSERRLDLLQGEALFEVAHEPDRPFRVYAAGSVAQAVGTKFNVRHTGSGVRVVVFEGKVLVDNRAVPARRAAPAAAVQALAPDQALLLAGQQVDLSAASGARARLGRADIDRDRLNHSGQTWMRPIGAGDAKSEHRAPAPPP